MKTHSKTDLIKKLEELSEGSSLPELYDTDDGYVLRAVENGTLYHSQFDKHGALINTWDNAQMLENFLKSTGKSPILIKDIEGRM